MRKINWLFLVATSFSRHLADVACSLNESAETGIQEKKGTEEVHGYEEATFSSIPMGYAYGYEREDYEVCDVKSQSVESIRAIGKRKKHDEKEKNKAMAIAKIVLREASDERCDWRVRPFAFIKGEVCGSYYKVLNIDRNEPIEKSILKEAFKATTKAVEPNINAAEDASNAYAYLQVAFDCLSDDVCRKEYNKKLDRQAIAIAQDRRQLKEDVQEIVFHVARKTYSGVSMGCSIVYEFGMDLWRFANQWEMEVPEVGVIPVGKFIMTSILLLRGQILLKLHGLSWLVVRINEEVRSFLVKCENDFE